MSGPHALSTALPAPPPVPPSTSIGLERAALRTAARQFEAIFVRQMLAAARATKLAEGVGESAATEQFRGLQDEHFAQIAADRGMLGLGDAIERQLSARIPAGTPAP